MTDTPRTWPEGAMPNPAQLLEWTRAAQDDEVIVMLASMLEDYDAARRCVMAEHDRGLAEANALRADATRWAILRDAYRGKTDAQPGTVDIEGTMLDLLNGDDTP